MTLSATAPAPTPQPEVANVLPPPPPPTLRERVDGVGVLIRAGFEPAASLTALGLPAIPHTGILPVTVQPEEDKTKDSTKDDEQPARPSRNGHRTGGHP